MATHHILYYKNFQPQNHSIFKNIIGILVNLRSHIGMTDISSFQKAWFLLEGGQRINVPLHITAVGTSKRILVQNLNSRSLCLVSDLISILNKCDEVRF